ncbi:MAG: 30S ribosomal protein S5 [Candidatus Melainabacteria bacterium]|nr:30S ribosomal protein S5 [Candidatus Melainabacteria bacterium]
MVQKVTKKETFKKRKKRRGDKSQDKKEASEWIEKVVQIRRVTKVVKGGKKLSFRAVVIVGNAKGQVGVGVGKALEVISAIQKGVVDAKKSLVTVPLIDSTIPHQVLGRAGAAKVLLKPAREGTGIKAGGAARTVLELGGIGDILSKSLGSRSPLNVARATLNGLVQLRKFDGVAKLRGLTLKEMISAS